MALLDPKYHNILSTKLCSKEDFRGLHLMKYDVSYLLNQLQNSIVTQNLVDFIVDIYNFYSETNLNNDDSCVIFQKVPKVLSLHSNAVAYCINPSAYPRVYTIINSVITELKNILVTHSIKNELMKWYKISRDSYLLETPPECNYIDMDVEQNSVHAINSINIIVTM